MIEPQVAIIAGFIGVAVGWFIGYQTTAYPSEDIMFKTLVELRKRRKNEKIKHDELSNALEQASDINLGKPDF